MTTTTRPPRIAAEARKARADLLRPGTREVRYMPTSTMECRTVGDTIKFRGVASSTESPYDMGFYTETIKRGAFNKTLARNPDVMLLINHAGLPISRTTNGTLQLFDSGEGLEFTAYASADDPDAKLVASKVKAGLLTECSFGFRVVEQNWSSDYTQRKITEVNLDRGDVSLVAFGANPNTTVVARGRRGTSADAVRLALMRSIRLRNEAGRRPPSLTTCRARAYALGLKSRNR